MCLFPFTAYPNLEFQGIWTNRLQGFVFNEGQHYEQLRSRIDTNLYNKDQTWRLYFSGWYEEFNHFPNTFFKKQPFIIQELYYETKTSEASLIRMGVTALRWSESWLLPSLDVWTMRRWDRLFLEPFGETLIHPGGILFRTAHSPIEFDFFWQTHRPTSRLPVPLTVPTNGGNYQSYDPSNATGIKAGFLSDLHRFSVVFKHDFSENKFDFGIDYSYPFDHLVFKSELGQTQNSEKFFSAGLDVFIEGLTINPQITVVQKPTMTLSPQEQLLLYYLYLSKDMSKHNIELTVFVQENTDNYFLNFSWNLQWSKNLILSLITQKYFGKENVLLVTSNQMNFSDFVGLRFEVPLAINHHRNSQHNTH
ncbi:MAG: hypothetical protein NZ480_07895 [Bdellovibrionaceae bacterium]|nr:hypothetical protein [Pseudobdellovibrionaceae bacterium]MDW8189490.1 hypothetical protein [Pseudobdellovibrionaceae bacterium]